MYERSYGYKVEEERHECGNLACDHPEHKQSPNHEPAAEIAKRIRADIKQAVKDRLLPAVKYSVRSESYSGGQSISVTVKGWPEAWTECKAVTCANPWCSSGGVHADKEGARPHDVLTEEAEAAQMTLDRIHFAYNWDGSEVQVDYFDRRYYGTVTFEDRASAEFHAREAERKASRRQAIDEAAKHGAMRVIHYKRDGSFVVHDAVELDGARKTALVCGARVGAHNLLKTDRELTCSRCAKRAEALTCSVTEPLSSVTREAS